MSLYVWDPISKGNACIKQPSNIKTILGSRVSKWHTVRVLGLCCFVSGEFDQNDKTWIALYYGKIRCKNWLPNLLLVWLLFDLLTGVDGLFWLIESVLLTEVGGESIFLGHSRANLKLGVGETLPPSLEVFVGLCSPFLLGHGPGGVEISPFWWSLTLLFDLK